MEEDDNVYKAERILDTKNVKGKRHFLIKWDGWDESNNTWEPEKNILDTRLIEIFYKEKSLGKSKNSKKEQDTTKKDENDKKIIKKKTDSNQSDLRAAIRIAEGLRPLSKSNENSEFIKHKRIITKKIHSSSESVSSSENSDIVDKKSKRNRSFRLNNLKSSNRFMRRRKISSSSLDSSSSSSIIPTKRRNLTQKNNAKVDLQSTDENEFETKPNVKELENDELAESMKKCHLPEQTDSTDSDLELIKSKSAICDNICVTDVTSGIVTVTIKECLSPNGFFKQRENV